MKTSVIISSTCVLLTCAYGNDGGLSLGGTPKLLKSHPSVSMESEVIKITVGKHELTVDCNFVFRNHGKACKVRMGFPDKGVGADDPDEETGGDVMKTPPKTTFHSFDSFIDGQKVSTKLIRADVRGSYWHTKTVSFPAHCIRKVRDVYTQEVGGGLAQFGTGATQIGYIVHTGASWHGNIGRTEIIVTFKPEAVPGKAQAWKLVHLPSKTDARESKSLEDQDALLWKGPSQPTAKGHTLTFLRSNWRPTVADDLELTYNFKS